MNHPQPAGLPYETARLFIRPMQSDDAAFILELLNEPSFMDNIGDKGVRSLEDALGYIQSAGWDNYARLGFGMNTVELSDSSARIGICGLLSRDALDHPDVGFALLSRYHGRGFATEAVDGMLQVAREDLALQCVSAITSPSNEASVRVLIKSGLIEGEPVSLSADGGPLRYFEHRFHPHLDPIPA